MVKSKKERYLDGCRDRLEREALKYARMKTFGTYLTEDGSDTIGRVCHSEQKDLTDIFLRNLGTAAEELLREIAHTDLPPRAKDA